MRNIANAALVVAAVTGLALHPAAGQAPPDSANAEVVAELVKLCRAKVQRQSLQKACLDLAETYRRGGDPSAGLDFAQRPQGGDIDVGGPWGTIVLRQTGTSGVAKFVGDLNERDPSVVVVPPQASTSTAPPRGGGARSKQRGGL